MRAVRYHGNRDIRVDQIDEPKCGKDQVKIAPAFAGICGSDLHEYQGGPFQIPMESPHPITGETSPVILGHEFSGIVEEVGADVTNIKVGDRVVVKPNLSDGTCGACKLNAPGSCAQQGFIGYSGMGGGMADHTIVPSHTVIPIPDSVSLEEGALVEPLAVAWHAITRSSFKAGDSVLVVGGGPIGIAVLQLAKIRGASQVIVTEVAPRRKESAKQFGATEVLDPREVDVVAKVQELTGGEGVAVAFDAAGAEAGLTTAVSALRVKGTLVIIAGHMGVPKVNTNLLVMKEKTIMGTIIYDPGDFEAVIEEIASGRLKPAPMITSKIRMEDVDEKGFQALIHDKDSHVKILIDINSRSQ